MNSRHFLIAAFAAASLPVAGLTGMALTGTILSTPAHAEEDNLYEHHREHCEALEREEHDLRERRDHTADSAEREHLEHRLHEIADDREQHCHR